MTEIARDFAVHAIFQRRPVKGFDCQFILTIGNQPVADVDAVNGRCTLVHTGGIDLIT